MLANVVGCDSFAASSLVISEGGCPCRVVWFEISVNLLFLAGPEYTSTFKKYNNMEKVNVADYKLNEKDTGSSKYQVANLTNRITDLTAHLQTNKKDVSSRRGLLMMVAKRRKHLDYIRAKSEDNYKQLIKDLGLRR